jgi:hypothetical protein
MPDSKKSRPKFFAPKPPIPATNQEVVENTLPETLAKPVIEAEVESTPPIAPTPPGPKLVTRSKSPDSQSPLSQVLAETTPLPSETKPELDAEPTKPKSPPPEPKIADANPQNPPKSSSNFFLGFVTFFSLLLAVAGWFMYFKTSGSLNLEIPSSSSTNLTPTNAIATTPSPTTASINPRHSISLEVLNGSGIAGAASQTADKLIALGYAVTKTGNADNQKYTKTEILVNSKFTDTTIFFKDLAAYGPATNSGSLKDSTASARIIIGKNWIK